MNWGIIGLGHMSKNFANSAQELENCNLIGVSSRSFLKLIKFGFKFKLKPKYLYTNYEKLLSSNEIDNIYIGTLNHTHFELIQKCLEAKKNVLCEKPITINLTQATEIKKKLDTSEVIFSEAIAYRSHPQLQYIIKLINQNEIGKIVKIKSSFGFDAGVPDIKGRLYNNDLGGGAILDLGCYPISMSNLIANLNIKEENLPIIKNIKGKIFASGVETEAEAKLVYDNGIFSEIKVSIIETLENTTTITGTEGEIKILDPWIPKKENIIELTKKGETKKLKSLSKLNLFSYQINLFEKIAINKDSQSKFYTMSIQDSVNCMDIMMQWKNTIIYNEKYKKQK